MSWERFRELFEEDYLGGRREGTRRVYSNLFEKFERICNPRTLRSITERTISAFAAGLRKARGRASRDGMQSSTIRSRLQVLHTVLQWAAHQKLIPEVPNFPSVKVPKKKPQPVPAEAFEKLLGKAADQQMRAFLLCGWLAGLRRNEALALEWQESEKFPWLDTARRRIWLPAEFVKADEDQWVPLDPELGEVLNNLPRCGRKVFHFTSASSGQPLSASGVSQEIVKLAKEAGVRMSMRALRRGFGCRYASRVPAQVLQRLMRHANIATTVAFYANVDDAVEDAVLGVRRNSLRNSEAVQGHPKTGE
jgi:integrase